MRRRNQRAEQLSLRVDIGRLRGAEIEHQHRGGESKNAVTQRFNAADIAAGEMVVVEPHGASIAFGPNRVNPRLHRVGRERSMIERRLTCSRLHSRIVQTFAVGRSGRLGREPQNETTNSRKE